MPKEKTYLSPSQESKSRQNEAESDTEEGIVKTKFTEDMATKEELNTLRQDLDSIRMKLKEREKEPKKEDIMDEETKKFLERLQGSMGSIEKRLSKQEEKDRQTEVLQQEARREEKMKEIVRGQIQQAVEPVNKKLGDLGPKVEVMYGMVCDRKTGECIVPTKTEVESLRGKIKDDLLNELKPKEEEKPEEKKPEEKIEEKKTEEEIEKEIKEKLPKGVLGTDLTLEEFKKDEKSQKVYAEKYMSDAGLMRALELCTGPECKAIREEMKKRGIKIQKKREGGGMLGSDWEDVD